MSQVHQLLTFPGWDYDMQEQAHFLIKLHGGKEVYMAVYDWYGRV